MGPGHGLAKRNHQQQTGKPHRMPTSARASRGKAEGGTGRPPPKKRKQGQPATPSRGQWPTGRRDTQNTRTHTMLGNKNTNSKQRGPEEKGGGDRDHETQDQVNQRPTPQSPSKKNQRDWGGAHPTNGSTRTPSRHRRPPRKGGGEQGTRTSARTPQQHLPKERRGAAETRTPTHTPTPHTRTGNGGEQEERAHSHARPKTLPRTGGVQAETQAQPHTPRTPAGKRAAKPQPVPKDTHPRPQPGLAGLPNPKPKQNPDPSTNATQQ